MGGFTSNSRSWLTSETQTLRRAEEAMAGVILTRSTILAPKESGELRINGRIEKSQDGGKSVVYGDSSVPYARRRHFENKKNPQTLHYLKRAGDSVAKENIKKYVDMAR